LGYELVWRCHLAAQLLNVSCAVVRVAGGATAAATAVAAAVVIGSSTAMTALTAQAPYSNSIVEALVAALHCI
jgi:hypothetical protein